MILIFNNKDFKFMKFLTIFFSSIFFLLSASAFSAPVDEEICNNQSEACKIACEAKRTNSMEKVEIVNGKMVAKNSASLMECLSLLTNKN